MSFYRKVLTGLAATLVVGLAAIQPGIALPEQTNDLLLSQENKPPEEGIPQLNTTEVRGTVTRVDDDEVEVRLTDGELRTYDISDIDEGRTDLEVGSEVVLSVRGDTVIAIGTDSSTESSDSMRSGSMSGESSSSSSSSSSSTVIRRETTVQQPTTRPAPAPAPAAQPVRGLW